MTIRREGDWQSFDDDRILEYLRDHDTANISELEKELPRSKPYYIIRERLRMLSQAGYVEPGPDHRNYELTRWGKQWLDGRVRADLLHPEPNPARTGYVLY